MCRGDGFLDILLCRSQALQLMQDLGVSNDDFFTVGYGIICMNLV